ncbi:flagellar filament capping protein FliD [Selenomonas sp. AB3002]|uniref:flagellar filament capping protein FliD n=1 Tax=Selenomonas sp. AB3002 TaxID=1392502 RepID=UPI000495B232
MSATGIYGLSGSGIDVDSMVKVGMLTKQNEYDRMYKKEVRQEWTKEAYANLYSDLTTFTTSTMSKYKMSATLNPQTVSSSNSAAATATANADAAAMTHYVDVQSMSSNAYLLTGNEGIERLDGDDKKGSLYLKDIVDITNMDRDGLSFTVSDGQKDATITITKEELGRQTLNDLVSAFNGAGLGLKASYDATNDSFTLYNNTGGKENGIYMKSNDGYSKQLLNSLNLHTVSVNAEGESSLSGNALTFDGYAGGPTTETEDVAIGGNIGYNAEKNTYTGVNVNGTTGDIVIGTDGSTFTFKAGEKSYSGTYSGDISTGMAFNLDFGSSVNGDKMEDVSYTFTLKQNGDKYQPEPETGTKTITSHKLSGAAGEDATVVIDGKEYKTNTNKLTVSNVTYTFAGTGKSTMTVSQDTEKVVENVKAFVDDYNKLLDKLNDMYNEQKYSDYDVLTESQKKGMTEEQIEKWEEKAKSGLMHRNEYVGRLISDLREAIYTPVESVDGKYKTMMSLGIESKTDRGHLKIDEDKLRKVIAEDPDIVYQMMGNLDKDDDYSKNGVVQRVSDVANKAMKSIKSYAGTSTEVADGSSLGKLIQDMQQKMSNFKVMMNAFESALYKRYDKMESAIQKLGMQLGYITGGQ